MMEDKHEEDANLQVLGNKHEGKFLGLMFVEFEKRDEKFLFMEKIFEDMPIE